MISKGLSWKERGKIAGKFRSVHFPNWRLLILFLPLSPASHGLVFITPIPLNEQSTIEFIK
jgi:hypothetical protein